jgi:hypothetical protein
MHYLTIVIQSNSSVHLMHDVYRWLVMQGRLEEAMATLKSIIFSDERV